MSHQIVAAPPVPIMNQAPVPAPLASLLDVPNEILLKIAREIPNKSKDWNMQGLRLNDRTNEICKIAQFEKLKIGLDKAEIPGALLPTVTSIIHDDHNVHQYVRHLILKGQIDILEAPDDTPYLKVSTYDFAQLLLFFANVHRLELDSFTWSPPSAINEHLIQEDGIPSFPFVTNLTVEAAHVIRGSNFPFDILQMCPAINTLTISISSSAHLRSILQPRPPLLHIRNLTIRDMQPGHYSTYAILIATTASSISELQVGFADLPYFPNGKRITWDLPPYTTLPHIKRLEVHIARESWDRSDNMTANIQSIANLIDKCGPNLTTIAFSLQPPLIFEELRGGWTSSVPWSIIRDPIRNRSPRPATSFRIIGSYMSPLTPPMWEINRVKDECHEFGTFVENTQPLFTTVAWDDEYPDLPYEDDTDSSEYAPDY